MSFRTFSFHLCAVWLLFTGSLQAATLLSVDFGGGTQETDFAKWSVGADGAGIRTTTSGIYTLTLAGGITAEDLTTPNALFSINERTRGGLADSAGFTQADLLNDRVVATKLGAGAAPAGSGLLLQLAGFEPNTTYSVQMWGYEHNNRSVEKFVNFYDLSSGTETPLGGYTTTVNQLPLTNNDFSVTATVTSDSLGNIILKSQSNFDGIGIFNGVTVSSVAAVPEPTIGFLTLFGSTALLLRRRRRPAL